MSFRRFMSLVAMAFLWTGSQIPVYIYGENGFHTPVKGLHSQWTQAQSHLIFMATLEVLIGGFGS